MLLKAGVCYIYEDDFFYIIKFMLLLIGEVVVCMTALLELAASVSCFSFFMHVTTDDDVLDHIR